MTNTIKITVNAGIVENVQGLPPGYDYEVIDLDTEKHQ